MKIYRLLILVLMMFLAGCASTSVGSGSHRVAAEAKGYFYVLLEPGQEKEIVISCADASESEKSGVTNIANVLHEKLVAALTEKGFQISNSAKIKVDLNILGFGGEKEAMGAGGALAGAAVGLPSGILASKYNRGKGALIGALVGAATGAAVQYLTRETEVFMRVGVRVTDPTDSGETLIIVKTSGMGLEPAEVVDDLSSEVAKRVTDIFRIKSKS